MNPRRVLVIAVALASLSLVACSGGESPPTADPTAPSPSEAPASTPPATGNDPLAGPWRVTAVSDETVPSDAEVTMVFAGGEVSGNAGCNTYGASVKADGDGALSFGPIRSTLMMCEGPGGEIEPRFLQALERVRGYQGGDDPTQMALVDRGGTSLVDLVRMDLA